MRFDKMTRYYTKGLGRERSRQRVAAAKRAVQRDMDRNALTPELVRYQTPEERMDAYDKGLPEWEQGRRNQRAKDWIEARRRLRAMPEATRKKTYQYWQTCKYPGVPGYLIGLITNIERGQFDPDAFMKELAELRVLGMIWRKTGVSLNQQREEYGQRITAEAVA